MPDAYDHVRKYPLNVVLTALGFEDWKWRKNGTEAYGKCPVCLPKRNATAFSYDDSGKFHCFSCNVSGRGAIDLVKAVKQVGFQEAVTFLKNLTPRTRPQQTPQLQSTESSENPPFKSTYEKFAVPSAWLKDRGFTQATLDRFEVFEYHNPARRSVYSGSVMLKIRRWSDGECIGYLSRNTGEVTPEKPKYCFPKGVQKSLEVFGAFQLKEKTPHRVVFLVESPFAVMKFSQHGFAAVSCFGWSVSPQQASILSSLARGLIYLPDRNKRNEGIAVAGLLAEALWVKMPELPDGVNDPEQLSAEQISALT